jgi:hypothetical protein
MEGSAMAHTSLEDQSLDYSKPFVVGLWIDGEYIEKTTYPMKSTVESMAGKLAPWNQEVR